MISKIIPTVVKHFILQQKAKLRNQNIYFGKYVIISQKTQFEGYNSINNHSELTGSVLGRGSYIANNSVLRNTKVGRFCAIGDHVRTGLGKHPTKDFVSIHHAFFSLHKPAGFTFVKEQLFDEHSFADIKNSFFVVIGNDVWIGNNVLIMDGVSIGDVKEQNGQEELQQLDQSKLVPLLTAALKEAIIRIEALENATGE